MALKRRLIKVTSGLLIVGTTIRWPLRLKFPKGGLFADSLDM